MLTPDALAELIAAHTQEVTIVPPLGTRYILANELIDAIADALEAEYACTCKDIAGYPEGGLGLGAHYINCPADEGTDGLGDEYDIADWKRKARGDQ
jgi:hypothetical protein